MGGNDNGRSALITLVQEIHHPFRRGCIEVAGWLIDQNHGRGVGNGPGQGDPLLLAAGEFPGNGIVFVGEVELIEEIPYSFVDDLRFFIGYFHRDRDILGGGSIGQQFEVLVGDADFLPESGKVVSLYLVDRFAGYLDEAAGR